MKVATHSAPPGSSDLNFDSLTTELSPRSRAQRNKTKTLLVCVRRAVTQVKLDSYVLWLTDLPQADR